MEETIRRALEVEAQQRDLSILFAVESGSRAWGFASPDSDYDVRVVYVRPRDWYLGLAENLPDTWEAMLPGDLDIAAWDLRKALRQLMKSNCSFFEWIDSPIVYSDAGLLPRLRDFVRRAFDPARAVYHYASLFRHAIANKGDDGRISIKKLCYALRANAAVEWVFEHLTMPPTEFGRVLAGISISDKARQAIQELLILKSGAAEVDRIVPSADLSELLVDRFDEAGHLKGSGACVILPELLTDLEDEFRFWLKS